MALPYRNVVEAGNLVFVSGQLPVDPATGDFVPGGVDAQTHQVFVNLRARLAEAGCTLAHVVKTTVFIADESYFSAMNEVYAAQFGDLFPARSCIAVKWIPRGALVEIEAIAAKIDQTSRINV